MSETWQEWFDKEQKRLRGSTKKPGKRQYLHFDNRIAELNEGLTRALTDPLNVARHPYYPFLRIDTRQKKYRRLKIDAPKKDRRFVISVKRRPIDFAAHKDSIIFSRYASILSHPYEAELLKRGIDNAVIAYRSVIDADTQRGKSCADFAKEALDFVDSHAPCEILALDVSKFFEEIRHDDLKRLWAQILGVTLLPDDHLSVFEAVTTFRFVRKGRIKDMVAKAQRQGLPRICTPQEYRKHVIAKGLQEKGKMKGIPQGSPISCVLANLYMLDFDSAVAQEVSALGGFYRRYSDDILIAVPEGRSDELIALVDSELKKLGLVAQAKKTEQLIAIENGDEIEVLDLKSGRDARVRYLGVESDGTTIQLRHGSLARFQRRMNRRVGSSVVNAKKKGRSAPPKKYLHGKFGKAKDNFLSYADRASHILGAPNIRKQVSPKREAKRLREKIAQVFKKKGANAS